jgi:hypothetical protein
MDTYFTISFEQPSLANLFSFKMLGVDILSFGVYNEPLFHGVALTVFGFVFAIELLEEGEDDS